MEKQSEKETGKYFLNNDYPNTITPGSKINN